MIRRAFVLLMVMVSAGHVRSEQVLVTGVAGQVLFGGGASPWQVVKAGQRLGAGTFSAGANGILYLSTFTGSELRLGESGTLRYDGTEDLCHMEGTPGTRSNFHLIQGKLQITIRFPTTPPHCYHIVLPRGEASMSRGECVMCMHGGGTYLFVARGDLFLTGDQPPTTPLRDDNTPVYGALPVTEARPAPLRTAGRTEVVVGSGEVGVVNLDGSLGLQPLSALAAGTQTCLLSGFDGAVAEGSGKKSSLSPDAATVAVVEMPMEPGTNSPPGNPIPFRRNFVVSPTQ